MVSSPSYNKLLKTFEMKYCLTNNFVMSQSYNNITMIMFWYKFKYFVDCIQQEN